MRSERVDARCYLIGANAAQKKERNYVGTGYTRKWLHRP